jgi:hypothetical protein
LYKYGPTGTGKTAHDNRPGPLRATGFSRTYSETVVPPSNTLQASPVAASYKEGYTESFSDLLSCWTDSSRMRMDVRSNCQYLVGASRISFAWLPYHLDASKHYASCNSASNKHLSIWPLLVFISRTHTRSASPNFQMLLAHSSAPYRTDLTARNIWTIECLLQDSFYAFVSRYCCLAACKLLPG